MANKAMWDWMDKQEGRKEGDSTRALDKEKKRQGYKSTPVRTKALEKKYAPAELKTIGQNYKKLFDEQRYVDNRSSRRKHAREYDKEHGTKDNR
jgi:hypothetical protein